MSVRTKIKRITSMFLCMLILASVFTGFSITANAASGTTGTCKWSFNASTGKLSISGTGKMEEYSLSNPAPWAEYAADIKSVVIGAKVTSIGDYSFTACINLTSVSISNSVKNIGVNSFAFCTSLKKVTIPTGTTKIEDYAFFGCTSLKTATFSDTVKTVGEGAFIACVELKSVILPKNVTTIGLYAFGYTLGDSGESVYKTVSSFTIYGYSSTAAKTYASDNGITFSKCVNVYIFSAKKVTSNTSNTTFKSSNTKVAKVNSKGKVTGIKKGSVKITATKNGVKKTYMVIIKNPKFFDDTKSVKKGKVFRIDLSKIPGSPKIKSSDSSIIKIKANGKITAKKVGMAVISVKVSGFTLSCEIIVK